MIRAIVAVTVMLTHYAGPIIPGLPAATMGRQALLVMSGLFATQILLSGKRKITSPKGVWDNFRTFYKRRFLRLYPVYAVLLLGFGALLYRLGDHRVIQELYWHLAYGSNFLVFVRGSWEDVTGHLWTLSAIEQFYLLWPAIVLFSSRAAKLRAAWLLFGVGVLSNLASAAWIDGDTSKVLTPNCLPFLSLGALLALDRARPDHEAGVLRAIMDKPWLGGLLFVVSVPWYSDDHPFFVFAANMGWGLALPGLFNLCLRHASDSAPGLPKRFVAYLGRAGFVIYLIHPFVRQAIRLYFEPKGYPVNSLAFILAMTAVTLVLSALLHEFLEKPFIQLRARLSPAPGAAQGRRLAEQKAVNLPS